MQTPPTASGSIISTGISNPVWHGICYNKGETKIILIMAFSDIKTFEEVRQDLEAAYNYYLRTGDEDLLWDLAHRVLSNSLFVLNEDEVEDEFIYEFPADILKNKKSVITRLLTTGVGLITKVITIPSYGEVWLRTSDGLEYDDGATEFKVWEIYNVAVALYEMSMPFGEKIYK